jgi:hypothetical protein
MYFCNIRMKHLQHTSKTFYNIRMKHLQHTYETSKTLETYAYNMRFSPFFFPTTQQRAGDRQVKSSAVAAPSGGEQRGRQG